jgi:3-hydroxybutyryl-CoA dehydrogenase
MKEIKIIAIAGAGTMGAGIAQVTANAGFKTILFDINQTVLDKAETSIDKGLQFLVDKNKLSVEQKVATQDLLTFTNNINEVIADLIIEAVIERLDIKHDFFNKVAALNSPDCVLASNTSSIPITQIAAKIPNPERVIGIHFFNPAPIMKLVEIIIGAQSNEQVALHCKKLIEGMGKTCVIAADAPGFIVNRVARHYYVEGLKILEEKVASFNDIDALLESSGFKMGPFKLMDLIGVDTNLSVTTSMFHLFNQDSKFRPNRIQQQKVDAGHFGRKTGKGFYEY